VPSAQVAVSTPLVELTLSAQDMNDRPLAHLMVAHLLTLGKGNHDATRLRGREEHPWACSASHVGFCQIPMLHVGNTSESTVDRGEAVLSGVRWTRELSVRQGLPRFRRNRTPAWASVPDRPLSGGFAR